MGLRTDIINVIDLEATCWERDKDQPKREKQEIIEIGIVELDLVKREIVKKDSYLIKPEHSTLSDFCVNLTTITPNLLEEEGISYYDACTEICSHYDSKNRMWASWGDWDRQMFSRNPSNEDSTLIPVSIQPVDHLNIKTLCAMKRGLKKAKGLGRSCRAMGIEFEGTAHRGVDDAYNMSKVLLKILE